MFFNKRGLSSSAYSASAFSETLHKTCKKKISISLVQPTRLLSTLIANNIESDCSSTDPLESNNVNIEPINFPVLNLSNFKPIPILNLSNFKPIPTIQKRGFTQESFDRLLQNEYDRFLPNSKKIGHALISHCGNQVYAQQFDIDFDPEITGLTNLSQLINLHDIEEIYPFGCVRYRAKTPNGTLMEAKRFIDFEVINEKNEIEILRLFMFSPRCENGKEPFWGAKDEQVPAFKSLLNDYNEIDKIDDTPKIKGGKTLIIDPISVLARERYHSRGRDQNTVMGISARKTFENFYTQYEDRLTETRKKILKQSFEAPLTTGFCGQSRPEWLHAYAHSLVPVGVNPQTRDNLGAAPKWVNTAMIVLERPIRWAALNRPDCKLSITPKFEMLNNSDICEKIDFVVSLEENGKKVNLKQHLLPFKQNPLYHKASDTAQTTLVAYGLLNQAIKDKEPVIIQNNKVYKYQKSNI